MVGQKRVLWISRSASLCEWHGETLLSGTVYSTEETELKTLGTRFAENPRIPTYVVVDLVDEEYNTSSVPHVNGRDRTLLVNRTLDRTFKGATYRYAQVQGRESTGRRDDVLLCSAITKTDRLDPYMNILREGQVSIRGVFSLPFVTERLLSQLNFSKGAVLLATVHNSGLRLSFMLNGKLKLSRILPSTAGAEFFTAEIVSDELEKTQRYLARLRIVPNGAELQALVISPVKLNEQLTKSNTKFGNAELKRFTVSQVAEKIGLKNLADVDDNNVLLMALMFKSCPPNHYGTAQDLRWAKLRDWNSRLQLAGGTFFVLCALQASSAFVEGLVLSRHGALAQTQAATLVGNYDGLARQLPPSPVNADQLKSGIDALDDIEQKRISIEAVIKSVSRVVSARGDVAIDSLEVREEPNEVTPGENGPQTDSMPQENQPTEPTGANLPKHVVSIRGQITHFDGNYQHATEQVNATLNAMEHAHVLVDGKVVQAPLDASPQRSLIGEAGVRESLQRVAVFTIEGKWNETGDSK